MARQAAEAESELELALMTFERLLPTPLRVKQRAALERVTAAAIAVGAARTPAALLNISAKAAMGRTSRRRRHSGRVAATCSRGSPTKYC